MRGGATVAVIIPALDEAASIVGVIRHIPDGVDHLVVVDNGSTDDTGGVARENDVLAVGKRSTELVEQALERPPAHDERPALRERLEASEVGREVPRELHAAPDEPVGGVARRLGHGGDDDDLRAFAHTGRAAGSVPPQTATGKRIAGCGS